MLKLYLKQKDEGMSGKVVFFLFVCLFCFCLCASSLQMLAYTNGTIVWIIKGNCVEGVRLSHRRSHELVS